MWVPLTVCSGSALLLLRNKRKPRFLGTPFLSSFLPRHSHSIADTPSLLSLSPSLSSSIRALRCPDGLLFFLSISIITPNIQKVRIDSTFSRSAIAIFKKEIENRKIGVMAEDKAVGGEGDKKDAVAAAAPAVAKKKRQGIFSRMFSGIFRLHRDDFEKRLQYISKEEATVLARMQRRTITWRRMTRHLILFSVFFEVIAIFYAIVTTRATDLDWKMRTFRILPMFLLPAISSVSYSAFASFTKMRDRKDTKTLERLRAERQAKIDELKERTNYYTTQQLIQRYDPDPAAKAAAATVLASKLSMDSGMKFYVGDESKGNASTGKSHDVDLVHSGELRNRKPVHTRSNSTGSVPLNPLEEETPRSARSDGQTSEYNQLVVSHHNPQGPSPQDGGWIARIAALLVGEDPTQSYALICGNCHMHNGLAKKEDFPYITYFCPHCHALNQPKHLEGHTSGSNTPMTSSLDNSRTGVSSGPTKQASDSLEDSAISSASPVRAGSEIEEATERPVLADTISVEKRE
ncbi:hypothetical protein FF1_043485 [Malus domestica]